MGWVGVALALAGCGGGGSSSPKPDGNGNLLFDDFSAASLDSGRWGVYSASQELQRTRFGTTPQLLKEGNTSFARLSLDTYNPDSVGQFKGTEIDSRDRFARNNGIEFEARLRAPGLPPGIVFAFFGIYDRFTGTPSNETYLKDEVDFEFLTAQQEQFTPTGNRNRLYLNIWDDWNVKYGYDQDNIDTTTSTHTDKTYAVASNAGYDYANWNTYTFRIYPDRTEYYLNGHLERTEREVKPDDALSVHFNIWTSRPDFVQAYSDSLQPSSTAAGNKTYVFDVDYVRVRQL